jgi:hypothetical protein
VAVFYRIGRSGRWKYAADVVPATDVTIQIPHSDFPEAHPGEVIPVSFKAFDGLLESAETEPLNVVVNHPPVLTVNGEAEPVIRDDSLMIEMPFQVSDVDGDPVTLFYKFDDAREWSELPASDDPRMIPGSVFAALDPNSPNVMQVFAFDGYDESELVTLSLWSRIKRAFRKAGRWFKKVGKKIWRGVKKVGRIVGKVAAVVGKFIPGPIGTVLKVGGKLAQLIPHGPVSYSIDGGKWSEPVQLADEEQDLLTLEELPAEYLTPGSHSIKIRFGEEGNYEYCDEDTEYYVNSAPSLQLTDDKPLSFKSASTNGVPVPIVVSDGDGDPITVFYRFQGDETWAHLPTANGEYVLPADAFSDRLADGSGAVEIFAWDGFEKSGDALKIPYSAVGTAAGPEANEEPIAEDSNLFGALSPAAFAGIIVGGVAVIAIVIGIVVYARRKKHESTSTGLIEDE